MDSREVVDTKEKERLLRENSMLFNGDHLLHVPDQLAQYFADHLATERQRAEAAEAKNGRLQKALRPFAEAVDEAGDAETDKMDADAWEHPLAMAVKVGDFHNARAALQPKDEG